MLLLFTPALLAMLLTVFVLREALFPPEIADRRQVLAGRTAAFLLGVSEALAVAMYAGRVPDHNPAPIMAAIAATALGGLVAALMSFRQVRWLAGAAGGVLLAWIGLMLVLLSALSGLR